MNQKFKIGQKVAVMDDTLTGKVLRYENNEVVIETTEGFELSFPQAELVVIVDDTLKSAFRNHAPSQVMAEKEVVRKKQNVVLQKTKKIPYKEVDLHIDKLVKNYKGMHKHDILTYQLDTAKRELDWVVQQRLPGIVFIHGVGQGILKEALTYELSRLDYIYIKEADYQKYGQGAIEVGIIQKKLLSP